MRIALFAASALALFAICANVSGQSQAQAPAPPPAKKQAAATKSTADQDQKEGERRFFANCGRCHNPPESISPQEVNAVLRHMRVRAMLSAEDEELIRKYLAP
ncbi:MAG TPA: cytochrome c [Candidatus Acidoferrum sp.]|jgi:cytochrome c5